MRDDHSDWQYRASVKAHDYERSDSMVLFRTNHQTGKVQRAKLEWIDDDPQQIITDEDATLPWSGFYHDQQLHPAVQAICDLGYELGYRPSGFDSNVGELAASKEHLDDMRRIVMHQLGVPDK